MEDRFLEMELLYQKAYALLILIDIFTMVSLSGLFDVLEVGAVSGEISVFGLIHTSPNGCKVQPR